MSRTKPTPAEIAMLRVACSRCLARRGEWCWNARGKRNAELHAARFNTAHDLGLLPVP